MESYVGSCLSLEEEVICKGRASRASFMLVIVFDVLLLLLGIMFLVVSSLGAPGTSGSGMFAWFLIIAAVSILISVVLTIRSIEIALTNKRVIAKFGFFQETTIDIRLDNIDIIEVKQGIMGRLFSYGSISFRSIGGINGFGALVPSIKEPLAFRRAVYNYMDSKSSSMKLG